MLRASVLTADAPRLYDARIPQGRLTMVRTAQPKSDNERLGDVIRTVAEGYGFEVHEAGWARTTYDVIARDERTRDMTVLVRVESFATTNGEIRLLKEAGRKFAEKLGTELEKTFPEIGEALILEGFK